VITNARGFTSTYTTYDALGYRTVRYEYDAVGNPVCAGRTAAWR
jgi:hypothetical protein